MLQAPNECIGEAMEKLTKEQFYSEGRQVLFETLVELHDGGDPVELISLTTTLRDRKQLDLVGGASELAEILTFAPSAAHFSYYAGILRDKYPTCAKSSKASNDHIKKAYDDVPSVNDLLDGYERDVLGQFVKDSTAKTGFARCGIRSWSRFISLKSCLRNKDALTGSLHRLQGLRRHDQRSPRRRNDHHRRPAFHGENFLRHEHRGKRCVGAECSGRGGSVWK